MRIYFLRQTALVVVLCVLVMMITGCLIRKPFSHHEKLGECSDISQRFSFKCPSGHCYHLLLGVPPLSGRLSYTFPETTSHEDLFAGIVKIYHGGQEVYRFTFDTEEIKTGNWLDEEGLETFILTSTPDALLELDPYLEENMDYEVVVTFSNTPPDGATLWLSYLSFTPQK